MADLACRFTQDAAHLVEPSPPHLARDRQHRIHPSDVEIDTGMVMVKMVHADEIRLYSDPNSLASVAVSSRNLTVPNFPRGKLDIDAHPTPEGPAFTFRGSINALQSYVIRSVCENDVVFDQGTALMKNLLIWNSRRNIPSITSLNHNSHPTFPASPPSRSTSARRESNSLAKL